MNKIRKGASGVSVVAHRVQAHLESDWQTIDAENDDAVDGIIFLRHRNKFMGRAIFAQVKSGPGFKLDDKRKKYPGKIPINVGGEYIVKHRPRWRALPGPVILIYVLDPDGMAPKIYWQDLNDPSVYSDVNKSVILMEKAKTFGSEAKGALRRLSGSVPDGDPLQDVDLRHSKSLLAHPGFELARAKKVYRDWSQSTDRFHPALGEIHVTNSGWRHITRRSRRPDNVFNSLLLMEAAREMIIQGAQWRQLGSGKMLQRRNSTDIVDMLSLRANVLFRYRSEAPVQVILRRTRSISKLTGRVIARISFHSVHELQRGNSRYYG